MLNHPSAVMIEPPPAAGVIAVTVPGRSPLPCMSVGGTVTDRSPEVDADMSSESVPRSGPVAVLEQPPPTRNSAADRPPTNPHRTRVIRSPPIRVYRLGTQVL